MTGAEVDRRARPTSNHAAGADWLADALEDDMRRPMFDAVAGNRPFALATIIEADGGPRPVGSQMVITDDGAWGFLSGGCIEADVAVHGRQVLADAVPRNLVYGRGSPFIDMRLPCGGRLELMLERVPADDEAVRTLQRLTDAREPALWESDGLERRCRPAHGMIAILPDARIRRVYRPSQRLIVVGADPFALAMAGLGAHLGWESVLLAPFGPSLQLPAAIRYDRRAAREALDDLVPDPWTAIAVATHQLDVDQEVLVPALQSRAGYVGVLGSRRRLPERLAALRLAGVADDDLERLKAPIGLPIRALSPREIAVAVAGEIIDLANGSVSAGRAPDPSRAYASSRH